MRILLDEQLPRVLAADFPDHDVRTVQQQGWRGVKNGRLLQLASAADFEVFLTADRGIEFEQNLAEAGIAIVMLVVGSNRMEHLRPLVDQIEEVLPQMKAGETRESGRLTSACSWPATSVVSRPNFCAQHCSLLRSRAAYRGQLSARSVRRQNRGRHGAEEDHYKEGRSQEDLGRFRSEAAPGQSVKHPDALPPRGPHGRPGDYGQLRRGFDTAPSGCHCPRCLPDLIELAHAIRRRGRVWPHNGRLQLGQGIEAGEQQFASYLYLIPSGKAFFKIRYSYALEAEAPPPELPHRVGDAVGSRGPAARALFIESRPAGYAERSAA